MRRSDALFAGRWPRAALRACGLLALLLLGAPAQATTVAVLPLTKGAGSESWDGLGDALAGMLVSDLAAAPGLQLVERQRMDALLDEIELASTGFLDPTTAQQLGRGLGAEVVLTGSYSVVADTFLLDARLVRVDSGEVVKAADSQGAVAEFVAVEKALVEGLLDELEVVLSAGDRRRLMLQAPTESFRAFAAWGEGLAHQREGALDEARAAFERAVAQDPEFEAARQALVELQRVVEQARAERRLVADAWLDERYRRVLDAVPDERSHDAAFRHDPDTLSAFALRQAVLWDAGLHCQRVDELRAWLDREGWQVAVPQASPATGYRYGLLAQEWELSGGPYMEARRRVGRTDKPPDLNLYADLTTLLLGARADYLGRAGQGLVDSLRLCQGEEATPAALRQLRADLELAGRAGQVDKRSGLSAGELLDLVWAWQVARTQGATAELSGVTAALVRAERPEAVYEALMVHVDTVLREADLREAYVAGTLGQDEAELERLMRALGEGDEAVLDLSTPTCQWLVRTHQGTGRSWTAGLRADLQRDPEDPSTFNALRWRYQMAGMQVGPLRDMGCVRGTPGRYAGFSDAAAALRGVRLRPEKEADPGCVQQQANLEAQLDSPSADPAMQAMAPQLEQAMTWGILTIYYSLVSQRCVPLPER